MVDWAQRQGQQGPVFGQSKNILKAYDRLEPGHLRSDLALC